MGLTRSQQMARIRTKDTKPETMLRAALWSAGLRGYRKHARTPVGRPDLVFPGPRLAIFIDGCFWHGCPEHYVRPRNRPEFWAAKLRANVDRDRRQTMTLEAQGWTVFRVWEHAIHESLDAVVETVRRVVRDGGWAPEAGWRVHAVEVVDAESDTERRCLSRLLEPEVVRYVVGARSTKKWRRRRGKQGR